MWFDREWKDDYKPFTGERFRTALGRARERLERRSADPGLARLAESLRTRPVYLSRVLVRATGERSPPASKP